MKSILNLIMYLICLVHIASEFIGEQLFIINAFIANKFCLNTSSIFTAIYSQSIVNMKKLHYILLSKETNISKKTSDLLGSNQ